MKETIPMSSREQTRALVLVRVVGGELTSTEAATLLGLLVRQVWRLWTAFERDGPVSPVHANRGRPSSRCLPEATRGQILKLVGGDRPGHGLIERLAELIGTTRETLAHTLGDFRLRGLLDAAPHEVVIRDAERLCELAEGFDDS
jgi:Crp-like helix-turn-helix domain